MKGRQLGGQAGAGQIENWLLSLKHVGDMNRLPEKQQVLGCLGRALLFIRASCLPLPSCPIPPLPLNAIDLLNIFLFRFLIPPATLRFTYNTNLAAKSSFLFHI